MAYIACFLSHKASFLNYIARFLNYGARILNYTLINLNFLKKTGLRIAQDLKYQKYHQTTYQLPTDIKLLYRFLKVLLVNILPSVSLRQNCKYASYQHLARLKVFLCPTALFCYQSMPKLDLSNRQKCICQLWQEFVFLYTQNRL